MLKPRTAGYPSASKSSHPNRSASPPGPRPAHCAISHSTSYSSLHGCRPRCDFVTSIPIAPAYSSRSLPDQRTTNDFGPAHFVNRELSWLEFNQRVLDEALDRKNPLLERVKFFCIVSSNLDEFFEVRVAGMKQQMESDVVERSVDGLTATEMFRAVNRRIRRLTEEQYRCWREDLRPALARNNIRFLNFKDLSKADLDWLEKYYLAQVRPVLTPLAIDPAHPFPQV